MGLNRSGKSKEEEAERWGPSLQFSRERESVTGEREREREREQREWERRRRETLSCFIRFFSRFFREEIKAGID